MTRRLWRAFALAPMALALGACMTVGPDYKLPKDALVNAPLAQGPLAGAQNAPVAAGDLPADWWRLYDDPVLDSLVQNALKSNTRLREAAANIERSSAVVEAARAAGGFTASTSAMFERAQESGEQYLLYSKLPVANEGVLGLNVSYELDLFGKLRRGVEAARADDEAAQAAADLARITVVAGVVQAYVESCAAGDELAIAQQSLRLQRERVRLSQRLRDVGRGDQPEVTRGVTQAQTIAADIPRLVGRQRAAQYQLAMLLAVAPASLPPAVQTCSRLPQLTQPIPVGDGATLLKRRPDVREAERQLAAATARIGVATAALYPSISLGASAGSVGVAADLFQPDTNRWSIGPLISWSFPINGQRQRVSEAQASTRGALAHFDGVVLNALRETQTNLASYAADAQHVEALRAAFASAQESANETHRLYAAGRESFLADLDATRTLTSLRAQVAAAEGQEALDQVKLFLSLGGGWEQTQAPAQARTEKAAAARQ